MTDRMTPTVLELKCITELANKYRQQLVADLAPEFPGREAYALAGALSVMFATSMTSDPGAAIRSGEHPQRDHVALAAHPPLATGQAFELRAEQPGDWRWHAGG